MSVTVHDRAAVVRRGKWLTWVTIGYNGLEAVLSIGAGIRAGSIALVGFGLDSIIELTSNGAGLWRLRADAAPAARARAERLTLRTIGVCFLLLAAYVLADAVAALLMRQAPESSPLGIAVAVASVVSMPVLARAKRRVASQLSSRALTAEARQTQLCMYMSAILLAGLALNATVGWWWADPVAALVMVPIMAWEGAQALRGRTACADCGTPLDPG